MEEPQRSKNIHEQAVFVYSLLAVAVVAEGAFEEAVQSHQTDLIKHIQAAGPLSQQVAPLCLRNTGRETLTRSRCAATETKGN